MSDVEPIRDWNEPGFLSDANIDALEQAGERVVPAKRGDYCLGPNETVESTNSIFVSANDKPMPLPDREPE